MAKTYNNLFPAIYDFENLHRAYLKARRGKRHTPEVLRFERNLEGELIQLQNELIWGQYETGPYRVFHVYEPKKRIAAALPFRDRVIHHALVAVLEPIWETRFIHHSYACRKGKGMHAGADQAQQWLREVQQTHGHVHILKADIAAYFASIDQERLMALLAKRIACRRTLDICAAILRTWAPGLPIGNLTSQLWANIYLHALDEHIKHDLREHRYMRYMDDWIIVHHDKTHLHRLRRHLEAWLRAELGLALNRKTQIFPVAATNGRALDFLGYRIWTTHRKPRKDSAKRMKRRLRTLQRAYAAGHITLSRIRATITSWLAHISHTSSARTRASVLGRAAFVRHQITPPSNTSAAP